MEQLLSQRHTRSFVVERIILIYLKPHIVRKISPLRHKMKEKFSSHSQTCFAHIRLLILFLCVLCSFGAQLGAQDFKAIHPGVEFAQVEYKIGRDPVKINLLRLDLTKVRLDVRHAMDAAIGTEKTSSIATRHGTIAAINAGFFRLDKSPFAGDSVGLLVIDGELYSESSNGRVVLVIANDKRTTSVLIDHIEAYARVYPEQIEMPEINGINRERKKGEAVLYSSRFGQTTLTDVNSTEIILTRCRKTICREFSISDKTGNSSIPRAGFVLSLDPNVDSKHQKLISDLKNLSYKEKKHWFVRVSAGSSHLAWIWRKGVYAIAGVPQLIKNGKIAITWEQEKSSKAFVETRHPRTAVAKMKDGKFLMITVDGRQPGVSVGMNLNELAEYLFSLGAVEAMNLDGGGSTTMFLDGKVVNTPSDKEGERKVSDAILVTLRKKK
jgi:exopolysaccharide biosynthesis protein